MGETQHTELDALMAQLARGEREVFSLLFQRLWTPVFRFCISLSQQEADASDAAQEAMIKILERASDYDPTRPVLPWALAIAAWECRTLSRKRFRRKEIEADVTHEIATPSADEEYAQKDLVEAALRTLGTLSTTEQETLLATFLEEAASASGDALRKRRERALIRLRKQFKRLYGLE